MKSGYHSTFSFYVLLLRLFFKLPGIFIHVSQPLLQCFHPSGTFVNPVKCFAELLWLYFTIPRVFLQVFFVSHSISNEIDGCIGSHGSEDSEMRFHSRDPVTHPVLVLIILTQLLKIYRLFSEGISGYVTVRPVHDLQKSASAPVSLRHFEIGNHISADPVSEQVGQFFLHGKRNSVLHQSNYQSLCLLIRAEKKSCVLDTFAVFHTIFQSSCYCHIFISWISKFQNLHRLSHLIGSREFFHITVFVIIDHLYCGV